MEFESDEAKRDANLDKHGLDFLDARTIWRKAVLDPCGERKVGDERRLTALGVDDLDGTRTDWARLRSLTDADVDAAIADDPDSYRVDTDLIGRRGGSYAYQLYADSKGTWRWALRSASGEVLAVSGKSFANRAAAEAALSELREVLLGARSEAA